MSIKKFDDFIPVNELKNSHIHGDNITYKFVLARPKKGWIVELKKRVNNGNWKRTYTKGFNDAFTVPFSYTLRRDEFVPCMIITIESQNSSHLYIIGSDDAFELEDFTIKEELNY